MTRRRFDPQWHEQACEDFIIAVGKGLGTLVVILVVLIVALIAHALFWVQLRLSILESNRQRGIKVP